MGGERSSGAAASQFSTEDIIVNILLRLQTASSIARFRCVSKSWRILLSDPQFLRRFLFSQNPQDLESLRILFAGGPDAPETTTAVHYSLHSYDNLGLIVSAGDLPCVPSKSLFSPRQFRLTVVGCCGGIFCIADANPGAASDIILWNPATSETKLILPRTSCSHPRGLEMYDELAGFGYDPDANDYRVVRILKMDIDECSVDFPLPQGFMYAEVYSLRNDSWKKLIVDSADLSYKSSGNPIYVHQQRRNHKCYWFSGFMGECSVLSFDVSLQVFEYTSFSNPPAIHDWDCCACFMSKESFLAFFRPPHGAKNRIPSYQMWGLLKQGVADYSWTKLFAINAPLGASCINEPLEIWKEGAHICSTGNYLNRQGHVYISRPPNTSEAEAEEDEVGHDRIEIRGRTWPFQVLTYISTRVSLSHFQ